MTRRVLLAVGAAVYLLSFVLGLIFYFMIEGSFPLSSRYFWAYTGLPPLVLLVHLAAGGLLIWRPDRAAPAAIAAEVLFLAGAITGAALFWVTFRWLLLVAVVRLAVAGFIFYYLWMPFRRDRLLDIIGGGVGLLLGVVWLLSLRPMEPGCEPLLAGVGVVRVWERPAGAAGEAADIWKNGVELACGATVTVKASPPSVEIRQGESRVWVYPVLVFQRLSVDGCWATRMNFAAAAFQVGTNSKAWDDAASRRYAYVRYNAASRVQSRPAESAAAELFAGNTLSADLYVRIDPAADAVDIVALMHLRRPVYVHESTVFEIFRYPYEGCTVRLPGLADVQLPVAAAGAGADSWSPRLVNLQESRAVLYTCEPGLGGPFHEIAQADRFGDYLVFEDPAAERSLLVNIPDWRRQALRQTSPAAGEPLGANQLVLRIGRADIAITRTEVVRHFSVAAAVASTEAGKGSPVVRMEPGTYVNRMALRLVPRQEDYEQVAGAVELWPLPDWAEKRD